MQLYSYDDAGWFVSEIFPPIDPIKTARTGVVSYLIPRNTTKLPPPEGDLGLFPMFDEGADTWRLERPSCPPDPMEQLRTENAERDMLAAEHEMRLLLLEFDKMGGGI